MGHFELAQVNVATPSTPLSSPELAWFTDALDAVNTVADAAPGFRWRLQSEAGDATSLRVFDDDDMIINMSVWASLEALADFVYRDPTHVAVLRQRRKSFPPLAEAHQTLWWVPAGHRPSITEAEERLCWLRDHGPTSYAFTFKTPFPASGKNEATTADAGWFCPA
ncbi:DUF3291 domain-containing protein [Actinomycetospora soli]|uniref:DUF3291 domain-containing protein n=1 Tax=Actinomycetospora soli TaxID=2893887 RepID=UPI001E5109FD|nr:DUF3291 domain-containing protein [Actinomycetospora soli]MCD2191622.1 DUF3291 domain-containing protein [Actinomycetospora soli]